MVVCYTRLMSLSAFLQLQRAKGFGARPVIADGTLEALKWLALVSMIYDHVVRFVLSGEGVGGATAFGRLAFPLFAFIIAYNLSRPTTNASVYRRVFARLVFFGLLATPAYWYLLRPLPLNILFTFALTLALVWSLEKRGVWVGIAALLFAFFASSVDYGLWGVLLSLSLFAWCKLPFGFWSLAALAFGFTALNTVNGSPWGLLALPLIMLAPYISISLPRSKWLFYWFYPAHLSVIALAHYFWLR